VSSWWHGAIIAALEGAIFLLPFSGARAFTRARVCARVRVCACEWKHLYLLGLFSCYAGAARRPSVVPVPLAPPLQPGHACLGPRLACPAPPPFLPAHHTASLPDALPPAHPHTQPPPPCTCTYTHACTHTHTRARQQWSSTCPTSSLERCSLSLASRSPGTGCSAAAPRFRGPSTCCCWPRSWPSCSSGWSRAWRRACCCAPSTLQSPMRGCVEGGGGACLPGGCSCAHHRSGCHARARVCGQRAARALKRHTRAGSHGQASLACVHLRTPATTPLLTHTHAHIHTRTHAHIHTRTHAHTRAYTHTHVQANMAAINVLPTRSAAVRSYAESHLLEALGGRLATVGLSGYVFFGSSVLISKKVGRCVRRCAAASARLRSARARVCVCGWGGGGGMRFGGGGVRGCVARQLSLPRLRAPAT
jgi:hypothetical protein